MDPYDVAFVKAVIAFVLVAGTAVGTFWLWLRARPRSRPDLERALDALREDNMRLQAELDVRMADLEGRVDFVERRLVQQPQPARLPEAPARTPV
jgi:hypothetical protein